MRISYLILVAIMAQAMIHECFLLNLLGGSDNVKEKLGYTLNVALPNYLGLSSKGKWITLPTDDLIKQLGILTEEKGSMSQPQPIEDNQVKPEVNSKDSSNEKQEDSVKNQENSVANQENSVENQENSVENQENSVENQENLKKNSDLTDVQTCIRSYQKACISEHNKYRALHNVGPLRASVSLHKRSQSYAEYLAKTKTFQHSSGQGYGENLAASSTLETHNLLDCSGYAEYHVRLWYEEVDLYDFKNPGFSARTGHFTQLVWKASSNLGCGIAISDENIIYTVSQYTGPGNVIGQFRGNVLPK